ncbi:MAG: RsmD family RNA methyltransferase [Treponema sp.]|nr:RsmD family RNA methyltransferase [Treponema sp.]
MRITGGILLSRQVKVSGDNIRPSMDRMRESVFAVLGDLGGKSFLDLFSGSGIIALEAASRGASYVEAVEMDILKRKTLLENVKISPLRIKCRFMPVERYVKRAKRTEGSRTFDLIFCDPPFPYRHKRELLNSIAFSPLMAPGSRLLLHRPREEALNTDSRPLDSALVLESSREFGRSVVDFFTLFLKKI